MTLFFKNTALALLVVASLCSGCVGDSVDPAPLNEALVDEEILYEDPQGRFEMTVPKDWLLAQASNEVQWFATLASGEVTTKVSLFDETRSLESIQSLSDEDRMTQTVERFEAREVNGIAALVREAENVFGRSTTYYYRFEDSVVALVALYGERATDEDERNLAEVFHSVRATNSSSL